MLCNTCKLELFTCTQWIKRLLSPNTDFQNNGFCFKFIDNVAEIGAEGICNSFGIRITSNTELIVNLEVELFPIGWENFLQVPFAEFSRRFLKPFCFAFLTELWTRFFCVGIHICVLGVSIFGVSDADCLAHSVVVSALASSRGRVFHNLCYIPSAVPAYGLCTLLGISVSDVTRSVTGKLSHGHTRAVGSVAAAEANRSRISES